jgi:hypothetical protein
MLARVFSEAHQSTQSCMVRRHWKWHALCCLGRRVHPRHCSLMQWWCVCTACRGCVQASRKARARGGAREALTPERQKAKVRLSRALRRCAHH